MKSLPPNRRAALLASLGAILASSAAVMAANHGRSAGADPTQFGLGVLVGLSVVLLVAAFVKYRTR